MKIGITDEELERFRRVINKYAECYSKTNLVEFENGEFEFLLQITDKLFVELIELYSKPYRLNIKATSLKNMSAERINVIFNSVYDN